MPTVPRPKQYGLPLLVVLGVVGLVGWSAQPPRTLPVPAAALADDSIAATVSMIDQTLAERWQREGLAPAEPADDLTVLRRLSLVLHGTIPSLDEIRQFEADQQPRRLARWTERMLQDPRFGDYFAERFSRVLAGAENGQFVLFRRDRFNAWLSEQFHENRPWDATARALIAGRGLWTDTPATNFVTSAADEGNLDANKLAGRTVRAFLGQRIDCAQCHNHPFAEWKQEQFEGLAACFGAAQVTVRGIQDNPQRKFEVEDRKTLAKREVSPAVPFDAEDWPAEGTSRERLAAWVTHPDNRRFERAISNRIWGLLFGRPWISPVDDLPNPPESLAVRDVLDILGQDFREHGCDLQRLIRIITSTRTFRLSSSHPAWDDETAGETLEENWAVFPLTRLRPEQMIGGMLQAASVKTVDQNSHLLLRLIRFAREQDFVRDYGDLGDEELKERAGTIPQALLRMNGEFAKEMSDRNPISASGRIASMAPTDESALDTCFLTCLTRHPTDDERDHFLAQLKPLTNDGRGAAIEDLFWTLYNSAEFCWMH